MELARAVGRHSSSVVLLSGGSPASDIERRHSLAAWEPFLVLSAKGHRCTLRTDSAVLSHDGDPLALLDTLMAALRPPEDLRVLPFSGGALGYFAN
jgi:hypothetical protein